MSIKYHDAIVGFTLGAFGYKTASGPIVSVSDAQAAPLRSLLVNIEPVQAGSGDPSPDNVRPISGWSAVNVWRTGKNLLDYSTFQQYANWSNSIVTYGLYPTRSGNRGYLLSVVPGVTYTVSLGISSSSFPTYCYLCRANGSDTSERVQAFTTGSFGTASITFTTGSGWIYYVRMGSTSIESLFTEQMEKVSSAQLELGSTATPYEPYSGNQYTIQLGDTVYGGTLDVINGVLTVDRAYALLNDPNKWANSTGTIDFVYNQEYTDRKLFADSYTGTICSYLPVNPSASQYARWIGATNYKFGLRMTSVDLNQVKADASAGKIAICYTLATPITIPLTPTQISTLQGQNNVWADSGDVTLMYRSSI